MSRMGGPISAAIDKPKDASKTLKRLISFMSHVKGWLFLALVLSLISSLAQLAGPYLIGLIFDVLDSASTTKLAEVAQILGWLIGFYVLSVILQYSLSILMIMIAQKVIVRMRAAVFEKFTTLSISYFDRYQIGDMLSRISYDIDTINTSLSADVVVLFSSFVTVISAFVIMAGISLPLLSVFIITLPLSIFTTRKLAQLTRPLFRKRSAKLGDMNGYIEETISGLKTIKAYAVEPNFIEGFDEKNYEASMAYYEADYWGSISGPAINFINNISLTLISLVGSLLYLFQIISIGNISSFILYSRRFSAPITEASNMVAELQSTLAAAERVFKVLDEEGEIETGTAQLPPQLEGEVVFDHVHFEYVANQPIIKDVSLTIPAKSMVAIVGPTGGGKTTLVSLLMRFYDPKSGEIRLDGIPLSSCTRSSVREAFAMVLQDSWLFEGTIKENLTYGSTQVSDERLWEVIEKVSLTHFVKSSQDGLNTMIYDDGSNLSKGQKQLITIARAMLLDRPLVILDEATSNVDTMTEKMIASALKELTSNKTCFIIAHRLSTIVSSDMIVVVEHGEVVEIGTHQQLMNQGQAYHRLYNAQFNEGI
ncbi:MAG: ABC transporter ATP-binding protein/permease [Erysipelotrichaceae bacterium]|nr:ABC transporter ATP-binding protein/permease [Erysipelotrichaceae bacterium]